MPIRVHNDLPVKEILESENIFVMDEHRATHQDIRLIKIGLLNLMPLKEDTELQILRSLSNTPLQIDVTFVAVSSHESKNTSSSHLNKFYEKFSDIKDQKFDGFIITGAPVEQIPFEEVDYWKELEEIMEWTKTHVMSTIHLCWGAQAGLYYHYGIQKHILPEKVFGIFPEQLVDEYDFLTNGFDEIHYTPHSRHTAIDEEAVKKVKCLSILSKNDEIGSNIIVTKDYRQIFILGHFEYGKETLKDEYFRDLKANKPIHIPFNYFPDDDPEKEPILKWRSHANLLYRNWLNYVYQLTPFEIEEIGKIKEPIGTGSREDHGYAKTFTK